MGELQATLEFSVEFHKFINVDLFQRGYYYLRGVLQTSSKTVHKVEVANPQVKSLGETLSPAHLVEGSAVTKAFQVLYKNEEVILNQCALFRVHVLVGSRKIVELLEKIGLQLQIELWFSGETPAPSPCRPSSPMSTPSYLLSSRTLDIHLDPLKGVHCHLPVLFDYFHLCALTITVHGGLLAVLQPYISSIGSGGKLSRSGSRLEGAPPVDVAAGGTTFRPGACIGLGKVGGSRLSQACEVHRELCFLLLASFENLQQMAEVYMALQPPWKQASVEAADCFRKLEKLTRIAQGKGENLLKLLKLGSELDSCDNVEDFFVLANNDIAQLCAQNILLWHQFFEAFLGNEPVRLHLAKEHHLRRVQWFSEGYFVMGNPRKSMRGGFDCHSQNYLTLAEAIRRSRYLSSLEPLQVTCRECDGDAATLPIIFEDQYQEVGEFARNRSLLSQRSITAFSHFRTQLSRSSTNPSTNVSSLLQRLSPTVPRAKKHGGTVLSKKRRNSFGTPSWLSSTFLNESQNGVQVSDHEHPHSDGEQDKSDSEGSDVVWRQRTLPARGASTNSRRLLGSKTLRLLRINRTSYKPVLAAASHRMGFQTESSESSLDSPMLLSYRKLETSSSAPFNLSGKELFPDEAASSVPAPLTNGTSEARVASSLPHSKSLASVPAVASKPPKSKSKPKMSSKSDPNPKTVDKANEEAGFSLPLLSRGAITGSLPNLECARKLLAATPALSDSNVEQTVDNVQQGDGGVQVPSLIDEAFSSSSSGEVTSEQSGYVSHTNDDGSSPSSGVSSPFIPQSVSGTGLTNGESNNSIPPPEGFEDSPVASKEATAIVPPHEFRDLPSPPPLYANGKALTSVQTRARGKSSSIVPNRMSDVPHVASYDSSLGMRSLPPSGAMERRSRAKMKSYSFIGQSSSSSTIPRTCLPNRSRHRRRSPLFEKTAVKPEKIVSEGEEENGSPVYATVKLEKGSEASRGKWLVGSDDEDDDETKMTFESFLGLQNGNNIARSPLLILPQNAPEMTSRRKRTQRSRSISTSTPTGSDRKEFGSTSSITIPARRRCSCSSDSKALIPGSDGGKEVVCRCCESRSSPNHPLRFLSVLSSSSSALSSSIKPKRNKTHQSSASSSSSVKTSGISPPTLMVPEAGLAPLSQEAQDELKQQLKLAGALYKEMGRPSSSSSAPYFTVADDLRPFHPDGLHLIICVHGLDGNSADLRLVRAYLEMGLPSSNLEFLMSERNQGDTFSDFDIMTDRFVAEILFYLEAYKMEPTKISFIGHSLGTLLVRSAITRPQLSHLLPKLHTFLSLSGPHLGTLYNSSGLVNMGLWFMQKVKKSGSLIQLSLKDHPNPRETFLYGLARDSQLHRFKNILLCGSSQDRYVPLHSARIELCKAAARDSSILGQTFREMISFILQPVIDSPNTTLVRYDVHHALPNTANSIIGRAAHIACLDSELFIEQFFLVSGLKYFQ